MRGLGRLRKFKNQKGLYNAMQALLPALMCAFLLLAQTIEAAHSHENSLRNQFDCEICLKSVNEDDVLITEDLTLPSSNHSEIYTPISNDRPFFYGILPRSRAPPPK